METLSSVSEDVLNLILKKLDIKSATNLLISDKVKSKKVIKYVYPRLWFDYKDLKIGKYKKENYKYIHKIRKVGDLEHLKDFKNVKKIKFSKKFNQKIDHGELPPALTHLTFGHASSFNQNIDQLPSTLQELIFGIFSHLIKK